MSQFFLFDDIADEQTRKTLRIQHNLSRKSIRMEMQMRGVKKSSKYQQSESSSESDSDDESNDGSEDNDSDAPTSTGVLGLLPRKWSLALLGQTSANVAQNDSDASVAAEGVLGLLPRKWSLALLGQNSSKVAPQPHQAAPRQSVNALFKKLKEVMVRQRMLLRPDERESYDDAWGVDPTGEFVRREDTRLCFNRITEVADLWLPSR